MRVILANSLLHFNIQPAYSELYGSSAATATPQARSVELAIFD